MSQAVVWTSTESMHLAKSQHNLEGITLYKQDILKVLFNNKNNNQQQQKKFPTIEHFCFALGMEFKKQQFMPWFS